MRGVCANAGLRLAADVYGGASALDHGDSGAADPGGAAVQPAHPEPVQGGLEWRRLAGPHRLRPDQ